MRLGERGDLRQRNDSLLSAGVSILAYHARSEVQFSAGRALNAI